MRPLPVLRTAEVVAVKHDEVRVDNADLRHVTQVLQTTATTVERRSVYSILRRVRAKGQRARSNAMVTTEIARNATISRNSACSATNTHAVFATDTQTRARPTPGQ